MALELRRRVGASGRVVGCDFSEPMLELARDKSDRLGLSDVEFEWADALDLPYRDGSFDAVTVGFGVRNLADLGAGLVELARVLKPGGRLVILEITQPQRAAALLLPPPVVRPPGAAAGLGRGRRRRLLVPARVGAQLPAARAARGADGRRRHRAHPLDGPGGRDHRDPSRGERVTQSSVPPPVTQVMEAAHAWLPARLAAVERRLAELTGGHGEPLAADAGATLAAGGKRLRPMLVLLCAGPGAGEEAIRAATAIELVHMATLVHDDVLDGAPLRRGRPTVAARSGRGRAVATGDLLFSRAFAELGGPGGGRQVELLSSASVALALGELAQRRDAYDTSISAKRYLERCLLKTARLFECACLIGRAADGADGASAGAGGLGPGAPMAPPPTAARSATSAATSGSPSSSSTTCSTSPARPSAPARRSAPTCSTAP